MRLLTMILVCIMLVSCTHVVPDDGLGYLEQPKDLKGLWQNGGQPIFGLEFTSPSHYRDFYIGNKQSISYRFFKIFHITDDGLAYALQKRVENGHYGQAENDKEMTDAEVAQSDAAYYSYVLFDMSQNTSYGDHGGKRETIRIFRNICEDDLVRQGITLSEDDLTRPATDHWERVRPDGECEYYNWSSRLEIRRPTSGGGSTPYGYWEGTIEDLQKAYAHLYKR